MPSKNYIHFSSEDFASDAYFQNWVLQEDHMTNVFWDKWLKDHPEKKADVDLAIELIRQFNFKEYQATEEEFNEVWKNLKTDQMSRYRYSGLSGKKWYLIPAAASIVILIMTGFWFTRNSMTTPQVTEPIIVNNQIEEGADKATLTLEDGSSIALEKGEQYQTQNANSNGEQIIYKAGEPSKDEIAYNYLTIPRGGEFQITLSDGTNVWLNSESQLKYPISFTEGDTRHVELVYGEAYFDVSPSTAHKGAKFKVLHNSQEVEVLGTKFNIKAYKDETNVYTTLVEGKVAVSTLSANEVLSPNQQSIIDINGHNIQVASVNASHEISWMRGEFIFNRKPLKDIMKVLSRWYDMEVNFDSKDIEDIFFTGTLHKRQSIEETLLLIQNTNFINTYEINNKTVTLK